MKLLPRFAQRARQRGVADAAPQSPAALLAALPIATPPPESPSAAPRPTAWPPPNWVAGTAIKKPNVPVPFAVPDAPAHTRAHTPARAAAPHPRPPTPTQPAARAAAPTQPAARAGAATLLAHPTADVASLRHIQAAAAATTAEPATNTNTNTNTNANATTPATAARHEPATANIVQLDLTRLEQLGHLVPHSKRSVLTEQFRHIKRPLLNNARSPGAAANRGSLLMVTSALPREGKTFFSINLALSMAAEIDTAVLLVDADVVRPELMKRLGVNANVGLLDLLTRSDLELEQVVLHTNVPKLSLLPSGTHNELSSELLGSAAMETLLDQLMKRYPDHIVIFDVPPLLVTNEAQVLASHVGQVVMVVQAASTPVADIRKAFDMLDTCGVVMSVLNKTPTSTEAKGYGSYYG
jgi:protein-tyrosine kinase